MHRPSRPSFDITLLGQERDSHPLSQLLELITEKALILDGYALINRMLTSNVCCKTEVAITAPPISSPVSTRKKWTSWFSPFNAVGIFDKEKFLGYILFSIQ
jgi:hypothetical protein